MKTLITARVKLACITIPGFEHEYEALKQSLLINGRSLSTSQSYCNKLAQLALHFQKTISQITENEIKEFLAHLLTNATSRSQSEFKHMVYGMRYYFRIIGKELAIKLPSIPRRKKLPMVLSKNECRQLFALTKNVKHRTILKLIYSGGLRAGEASNLRWKDIDFDRMTIHIKEAKGNKERYVPLSANILNELATLHQHGIYSQYVFCGEAKTKKMTRSGIRFLMNQAVKRIGLQKTGVCLHTLRHSYATHLLEDGLDILSIKELLGHSRLETTLVYLQISHQTPQKKRSPLDNLIELPNPEEIAQHKSHLTEMLRKKISYDIEPQSQYRLFE